MKIEGLTLNEVGRKILRYLKNLLVGYEIIDDGELFSESYLLHFADIELFTQGDGYPLLDDDGVYNCASGFLKAESKLNKINGLQFIVTLVSNENYSRALLLYLHILIGDGELVLLIKNFMSD